MSLTIKELCVDLQKTRILKNINLEIRTGEFVSLLGASGCGKTTLLKSIAGLLETQEGDPGNVRWTASEGCAGKSACGRSENSSS